MRCRPVVFVALVWVLTPSLLATALMVPAGAVGFGLDRGGDRSGEARYIVRFDEGTSAAEVTGQVRESGGRVHESLQDVFAGAVVQMSPQAAKALRAAPAVASVEQDAPVRAFDTQDSPPVGLDRVGQRTLPLDATYDFNATGAGVTAYVVDTGIRADHVEFEGRVAAGFTSIVDGQGTGDCNGHGTHVAGTLGGRTYGIAKSVDLVPVRVLDCQGEGTLSGLISGLEWMVEDHQAGTPAVANISLGGAPSVSLDSAVQAAIDDGISVAVAVGNGDINACRISPARLPAALSVGATSAYDVRAPFSNYGRCLDMFAPGLKIRSAWFTSDDDTFAISGTSMASPHVAGAAAALLQADPDLSPAQVAQRLVATASTNVVFGAGAGSPNRLLWVDPELVVDNPN